MQTDKKIKKLENYLQDKKCILAFSGGSDSTLLAYILSKTCSGSLAVTVDNNMMPDGFIKYAQEKAKQLNIKHKIIKKDFLADKKHNFTENPPERCYDCRKIMYGSIQELPEYGDYDYVLEGTNLTDLLEDRPGVMVNDMMNMTSPLIECRITKSDVISMLSYLNLDYSHNTTCLATRIDTYTGITGEKLGKIGEAEKYIQTQVKQDDIRVRLKEDNTAVISITDPSEIMREDLIKNIREELIKQGFDRVYLDITGYEKTRLKYGRDDDGYTYKLVYPVDIQETYRAVSCEKRAVSCDNRIIIEDNIIITGEGTVSMDKTCDFETEMNEILPFIKRKQV